MNLFPSVLFPVSWVRLRSICFQNNADAVKIKSFLKKIKHILSTFSQFFFECAKKSHPF